VSVKLMQRFGSWIPRYSAICIYLRPLARSIHQSYVKYLDHPDVYFQLPDEVIRSLQVFRAIFVSTILNEKKFTRTIGSFTKHSPSIIIEFDASLFGGGILIFDAQGFCLGACSVSLSQLNFGTDSSYQNTAEFIIAVIGLVIAVKLTQSATRLAVGFRGDSLSALMWLQDGSFRSDYVRNASLVLMHTCFLFDVDITESSHLAAEFNTSADALSRGGSLSNLILRDSRLRSDTPIIQLNEVDQLVKLCDPGCCHTN
jgi:hypothetical protein